jgi:MoaA/NifB/PqqE/SkfB family radical SAM enzyme
MGLDMNNENIRKEDLKAIIIRIMVEGGIKSMGLNSPNRQENKAGNQDLFRASALSLDPMAISRALRWLRGESHHPYPTSVHLNLTLRCTARCVHCKQWTWPVHNEFTVDDLDRLFDIFTSWGVQTVTFGGGNPLMHRYICTALRMAYEKGLRISIISEGLEFSDELAEAICQYADWIRFSLDGPRSDIHDTIRNKPGLFDIVVENVRNLKSRQSSLSIGLNCLVQKTNLHYLSEMIELGQRLGLDTVLFKVPHGDDPSGHYIPSNKQWKEFTKWTRHMAQIDTGSLQTNLPQLSVLLGKVFKERDVLQGRPVRSFYMQEKISCFAPLFFLTCNSKGDMYPCDYLQADTRFWKGKYNRMRDKFCLGNVLNDSQEILKNIEDLLLHEVRDLPATGYDECGCCTRFCQLNASLTNLEQQLYNSQISKEYIDNLLGHKPDDMTGSQFL